MAIGDILRILMGVGGAVGDTIGQQQANAANQARYDQLIGGKNGQGEIADLLSQLNSQSEGISQDAEANATDIGEMLKGEFAGRQGQMQREIDALYKRNMDRVAGLGKQEEKDIDTAFRNAQAAEQASLRARGLGGSTIGGSIRAGLNRERSNARGDLGERVLRATMDADTAGSNQRFQNLASTNSGWMDLLSQYGNPMVRGSAQQGIRTAGMEQRRGDLDRLTNQRFNIIGNRNDTYQPSVPLDLYRQVTTKPYDPPNLFSQMFAGAGANALGGLMGGLAAGPTMGLTNASAGLFGLQPPYATGGGGFGTGRFF